MSERQIAIYHRGDEVFSGVEDEFNMQCDCAISEPLGPLMMTDSDFQRHVANPYPPVVLEAAFKAVTE